MSRIAMLCALLLLAIPAALPTVDAAAERQNPMSHNADFCMFEPRTLEWYGEISLERALTWFLAPCLENGATIPAMERYGTLMPPVNGVFASGGDHTEAGIQHGYFLGGKIVVRLYDDHAQLRWSQGITNCWVELPAMDGPQCVY